MAVGPANALFHEEDHWLTLDLLRDGPNNTALSGTRPELVE